MASLPDYEYRTLRDTIRQRGTARMVLVPVTFIGWAATAGALATVPAQAETADVTTAVVGTITLTTPPAGAVLVAPATIPGNATGLDAMTVTANTAYNVTVKADKANLTEWDAVNATYGTDALAGALTLTPTSLTGNVWARTVSTSDQKIASASGGVAMMWSMRQPLLASSEPGAR